MRRIFPPGDPRFLPTVARSRSLSRSEIDFLVDRMLAGESRFVPEAKAVYIGNIARSHVAEEAAHFLRASLGGPDFFRVGEHEFWGICVHEAAAFLGSKIIVPQRKPPVMSSLPESQVDRGEVLAHIYGYNLGEKLSRRLGEKRVQAVAQSLFLKDLVEPGAGKALYFGCLDVVSGKGRRE